MHGLSQRMSAHTAEQARPYHVDTRGEVRGVVVSEAAEH